MKISAVLFAALVCTGAATLVQAQNVVSSENIHTSTYRVNIVSRTTPAVSYRHHSGATKVNFQGTDLMPSATGEAKVNSKRGDMQIKAEFSGLQKPASFGGEYLTYVLWAISPEGRAVNLGEVLVGDDNHSKLEVDHGPSGFRTHRNRGTLLRRAPSQQRRGPRELDSLRHGRHDRGGGRQV